MLIIVSVCVYICYDEGMEVPNIIIDSAIGIKGDGEKSNYQDPIRVSFGN